MYSQQFEDYFKLFKWEKDSQGQHYREEWAQYESGTNERLVKAEAAKSIGNGLPCVSAFIIAFDRLRAAGTINPVRSATAASEPEGFTLTRDQYFKIPALEITRRYRSEPAFREAVDLLIAAGQI